MPTKVPVPTPTSIELEVNRPAFADSYFRYNPPGGAVDGDSTTSWCAVSSQCRLLKEISPPALLEITEDTEKFWEK